MGYSVAAIAAGVDATVASRESYERCAFALLRRGHVPTVPLSHLGFRLLLFLLGQRPYAYAAHYETIAKQLDSNRDSVMREAHRLRTAGLLRSHLIPPHRPLPFRAGCYTRTNVLRFEVDVERLSALLLLSAPPATVDGTPPTRREPPPPTGVKSRPSTRTLEISEPQPRLLKITTGTASTPVQGREAVSPETVPKELEAVARSWYQHGFGELGPKEHTALRNRLREGASLEQLHAAVVGASVCSWLRTSARSPFAVVFANTPSVARFAHEGRKLAQPLPEQLAGDLRGAAPASDSLATRSVASSGSASLERLAGLGEAPGPGVARAISRRSDRSAHDRDESPAFRAPDEPAQAILHSPTRGSGESAAGPSGAAVLGSGSRGAGSSDALGLSNRGRSRGASERDEHPVGLPPEARAALGGLYASWRPSQAASPPLAGRPEPSREEQRSETRGDRAHREQWTFERRLNDQRLALARWAAEAGVADESRD